VLAKAILFDFGGTLDADGVTWKERMHRLCAAESVIGNVEGDPARFDRIFYAADDALVGTIPVTLCLQDTVARLVDGVLRGLGVDDAHIADGLADRVTTRFVADMRTTLARNTPILAALAHRYRLGVVSNFYGNLVTVCDDAEVSRYFDVIVDSVAVGWEKPDPRIFHAALGSLELPPAVVTFVGDSAPRDMAGAKAAGMPHIWLVAERSARNSVCCPEDRTVESLSDLEGALL
jgi:putative hydrolase of the HAD superfamily